MRGCVHELVFESAGVTYPCVWNVEDGVSPGEELCDLVVGRYTAEVGDAEFGIRQDGPPIHPERIRKQRECYIPGELPLCAAAMSSCAVGIGTRVIQSSSSWICE